MQSFRGSKRHNINHHFTVTTSTSTSIHHQRLLSFSRCLASPLQARLQQLHVCRASCLPPATPTGRTQCCSTFGVSTSSLRPCHWRPHDTALVACAGTSQFQAGADGVPCAERYGAVVPQSTCSGIQPYWSSPSTVVFHTAAACPVIPSVNSRPSLFSGRSLNVLEHFARRHSVCTISFCLP